MATDGDGFSSPDLEATIGAFDTLIAEGIGSALVPDNQAIVAASYPLAQKAYTQKLGLLWKIAATEPPPAGLLAQIVYNGNDYRLIGYEFGTRAHRIPLVGNANPVLAFEWKGEHVFFSNVAHPGEKPHHRLPQFQTDVETLCEAVWGAALERILSTL